MDTFIDASPEVVTPETETLDVVTQEEGVEQEVAEPEKIEQSHEDNAKFKEQRLKYEKQIEDMKKSLSDDFTKQIEAIKSQYEQTNSELMEYRRGQEQREKEAKLKAYAEENGYDYDELKKQVELEEAREAELTSKATKLTEYEAVLQEKDTTINDLKIELEGLKMYHGDKEQLRSIDPSINIDELPDEYFRLRFNGIPIEKAILATKGETTTPAPVLGKVSNAKPESDYMSEEEWDSLPESTKKDLLKNKSEKVWEWQKKWFK